MAQPSPNGPDFLLGGLLADNGAGGTGFGDQQTPMPAFPPNTTARLFTIVIKGLKVAPEGFYAAVVNESTNNAGTKRVPFTPLGSPSGGKFDFRPGAEEGIWVAVMEINIDVDGWFLYFQMQNSHADIAPGWLPRWELDAITPPSPGIPVAA